jgi:hypothetical protein
MSESTDETAQPPPTEVDDRQNEQIREQRLDPDHRPDGAEVDNTQRTFDPQAGMFTDHPDYDESDRPYEDVEPERATQDDADEPSE